jgi:hypothetical protein
MSKVTAFWDKTLCRLEVEWCFRSVYRLHNQALMMKAVRTAETSVYFNETTRRFTPDGCHLHTRRHENLKSHVKDANRQNPARRQPQSTLPTCN